MRYGTQKGHGIMHSLILYYTCIIQLKLLQSESWKEVFHVGFASYEFTVLPLIGASSRPLRCTTEQLKYAGVSGLDEVSARGVSSSSENVSMKRDLI